MPLSSTLRCAAVPLLPAPHPQGRDAGVYGGLTSVLAVLGVWVEKGMGLIVPGFIPSRAGDLVEYSPSAVEFWVSPGI